MVHARRALSIAGVFALWGFSHDLLAQTEATRPPSRAGAGSTGNFNEAAPATPETAPAPAGAPVAPAPYSPGTTAPAPVYAPPAEVPPTYPPPAQVTPQPSYQTPATYTGQQPAPSYAGATPEPEKSEWRPSHPGVIIGVERAFGFYFSSGTRDHIEQSAGRAAVVESDLSGTTVNVLGGSPMGSFNPFSVPFVAVHGVVGGGFTFGGGIGYQTDTQKDGLRTTDIDALVVAPRAGYILDLGSVVSVWIRGGVTYSSQSTERTYDCASATFCTPQSLKQTASMFDLSLDPMFVFSPIPHLGLLLGPTIDVALSGTEDLGPVTSFTDPNSPPIGPERELRLSSFGVAAGVALFF